jgi:predicted transcriptional regulator
MILIDFKGFDLSIFFQSGIFKEYFSNLLGGMSIKNRSRTDIAVDILRVAMKGSNKSRIVCEANVNFNIATKYLIILKEKELIMHEKGLFITTEKGKIFHEVAKELKL